MKKRLLIGFTILGSLCLVVFIAQSLRWRAGLRHALNLKRLPPTTRVIGAGGESWTDYLFVADISISPEYFKEQLSGREFGAEDYFQERIESDWFLKLKPLHVSQSWFASGCSVSVNETRTRVYVRYISD